MGVTTTIQTWIRVLMHPGEQTFVAEQTKPQATVRTALIWMVISGAISGVLGGLTLDLFFAPSNPMLPLLDLMNLPPAVMEAVAGIRQAFAGSAWGPILGWGLLSAILITPFFFLVSTGNFYLLGRLLGGHGDFGRYAYLLAIFQAPLGIISGLLGLIPGLAGCLNLFLASYGLVLTYRASKVGLNLSQAKAMIVIAIPVGVGLLLLLFVVVTIIIAFLRVFGS